MDRCSRYKVHKQEITQSQENPVGSQEISLPKDTLRTEPLSTAQFKGIGYSKYYPQEFNPQKVLYLNIMGTQLYLIIIKMHTYAHRKTCSLTNYIPPPPME